jgi:flagellar protein FlaG
VGFSLTGAHVIFFVASTIVAGAVSGVFMAVTMNINSGLSEKGNRLQEQLDTEFKIINDNDNIPNINNRYHFYLKNIGNRKIITTNETLQLFVDGDIISKLSYNFSDDYVSPEDIIIIYVDDSEISAGDHTLKVVGPLAIDDEFTFTI